MSTADDELRSEILSLNQAASSATVGPTTLSTIRPIALRPSTATVKETNYPSIALKHEHDEGARVIGLESSLGSTPSTGQRTFGTAFGTPSAVRDSSGRAASPSSSSAPTPATLAKSLSASVLHPRRPNASTPLSVEISSDTAAAAKATRLGAGGGIDGRNQSTASSQVSLQLPPPHASYSQHHSLTTPTKSMLMMTKGGSLSAPPSHYGRVSSTASSAMISKTGGLAPAAVGDVLLHRTEAEEQLDGEVRAGKVVSRDAFLFLKQQLVEERIVFIRETLALRQQVLQLETSVHNNTQYYEQQLQQVIQAAQAHAQQAVTKIQSLISANQQQQQQQLIKSAKSSVDEGINAANALLGSQKEGQGTTTSTASARSPTATPLGGLHSGGYQRSGHINSPTTATLPPFPLEPAALSSSLGGGGANGGSFSPSAFGLSFSGGVGGPLSPQQRSAGAAGRRRLSIQAGGMGGNAVSFQLPGSASETLALLMSSGGSNGGGNGSLSPRSAPLGHSPSNHSLLVATTTGEGGLTASQTFVFPSSPSQQQQQQQQYSSPNQDRHRPSSPSSVMGLGLGNTRRPLFSSGGAPFGSSSSLSGGAATANATSSATAVAAAGFSVFPPTTHQLVPLERLAAAMTAARTFQEQAELHRSQMDALREEHQVHILDIERRMRDQLHDQRTQIERASHHNDLILKEREALKLTYRSEAFRVAERLLTEAGEKVSHLEDENDILKKRIISFEETILQLKSEVTDAQAAFSKAQLSSSQLQQERAELRHALLGLQRKNTTLEATVVDLESNVTALQNQMINLRQSQMASSPARSVDGGGAQFAATANLVMGRNRGATVAFAGGGGGLKGMAMTARGLAEGRRSRALSISQQSMEGSRRPTLSGSMVGASLHPLSNTSTTLNGSDTADSTLNTSSSPMFLAQQQQGVGGSDSVATPSQPSICPTPVTPSGQFASPASVKFNASYSPAIPSPPAAPKRIQAVQADIETDNATLLQTVGGRGVESSSDASDDEEASDVRMRKVGAPPSGSGGVQPRKDAPPTEPNRSSFFGSSKPRPPLGVGKPVMKQTM